MTTRRRVPFLAVRDTSDDFPQINLGGDIIMPDFLQPGQTQLVCRRKFLSGLGAAAALPPVVLKRSTPQRDSIWIPIANLPRPKFHLGQEILAPWEDGDEGATYLSRATLIGMLHSAEGYEPGWWYLPRWIEHPLTWIIGKDDGSYWAEDRIRAIDERV